eukprot:Opistho-2@6462
MSEFRNTTPYILRRSFATISSASVNTRAGELFTRDTTPMMEPSGAPIDRHRMAAAGPSTMGSYSGLFVTSGMLTVIPPLNTTPTMPPLDISSVSIDSFLRTRWWRDAAVMVPWDVTASRGLRGLPTAEGAVLAKSSPLSSAHIESRERRGRRSRSSSVDESRSQREHRSALIMDRRRESIAPVTVSVSAPPSVSLASTTIPRRLADARIISWLRTLPRHGATCSANTATSGWSVCAVCATRRRPMTPALGRDAWLPIASDGAQSPTSPVTFSGGESGIADASSVAAFSDERPTSESTRTR